MTISTICCLPFKLPTFTLTKKQTSNNQVYYDNCNNISKEFNLIKPSELTKDDKIKLLEALMGKFDNHIYENGQTGKEIVTSITSNLVEILAHMTTQKLEYIDEDIDSNILTLLNDTKKGCEVLGLQFIEISGLIKLRPQIFGLPLFYSEVPKRLEELIHKVGERQMLIISNEAQKWLKGNGDYGDITFVTRRLVEIINTAMDRKKGEPQTIQYPRLVKPLPGGYKITATISILGRCEIQHPFITPVEDERKSSIISVCKNDETQHLFTTPIERTTIIKIEDDEIKEDYEERKDYENFNLAIQRAPSIPNDAQHEVAEDLERLLIKTQLNQNSETTLNELIKWCNQKIEIPILSVEIEQYASNHKFFMCIIKIIKDNTNSRTQWAHYKIHCVMTKIYEAICLLVYNTNKKRIKQGIGANDPTNLQGTATKLIALRDCTDMLITHLKT